MAAGREAPVPAALRLAKILLSTIKRACFEEKNQVRFVIFAWHAGDTSECVGRLFATCCDYAPNMFRSSFERVAGKGGDGWPCHASSPGIWGSYT